MKFNKLQKYINEDWNATSYLSIGHGDERGVDRWVLEIGQNELTLEPAGSNYNLHADFVNKQFNFQGRIDHNKRRISIISRLYETPEEELFKVIDIIKKDYPDYDIWYWDTLFSDPIRITKNTI